MLANRFWLLLLFIMPLPSAASLLVTEPNNIKNELIFSPKSTAELIISEFNQHQLFQADSLKQYAKQHQVSLQKFVFNLNNILLYGLIGHSIKSSSIEWDAYLRAQEQFHFADKQYHQAQLLVLRAHIVALNQDSLKQSLVLLKQAQGLLSNQIARHQSLWQLTALRFSLLNILLDKKEDAKELVAKLEANAYQEASFHGQYHYHRLLSTIYKRLSLYQPSAKQLNELVTLLKKHPDSLPMAEVLYSRGLLLHKLKQYNLAIVDLKKSTEIFSKNNDTRSIAYNLEALGSISLDMKALDAALNYFGLALDNFKQLTHVNGQALSHYNLGETYFQLKQYDFALKHAKTANQSFRQHQLEHYLVYSRALLGNIYLELKEPKQSAHFAKLSLRYAKENKLEPLILQNLKTLQSASEALNDFEHAYQYLQQLQPLASIAADSEKSTAINQLLSDELKQKAQRLKEYSGEIIIYRFMLFVALVALAVAAFYWLRMKLAYLRVEQKLDETPSLPPSEPLEYMFKQNFNFCVAITTDIERKPDQSIFDIYKQQDKLLEDLNKLQIYGHFLSCGRLILLSHKTITQFHIDRVKATINIKALIYLFPQRHLTNFPTSLSLASYLEIIDFTLKLSMLDNEWLSVNTLKILNETDIHPPFDESISLAISRGLIKLNKLNL